MDILWISPMHRWITLWITQRNLSSRKSTNVKVSRPIFDVREKNLAIFSSYMKISKRKNRHTRFSYSLWITQHLSTALPTEADSKDKSVDSCHAVSSVIMRAPCWGARMLTGVALTCATLCVSHNGNQSQNRHRIWRSRNQR